MVRRMADAIQRRGFQIVLRRLGYINGVQPNPPILTGAVLDGAALAGATSIAIRADQADGRIVQGDLLTIGTLPAIAVAADATARPYSDDPASPSVPGFAVVTLAEPLPSYAADGTPIAATWSADQLVWITESAFTLAQTSDQILSGDLNITMAAFGVDRPNTIDQLIIDGFTRSIITVARAQQRGQTAAWLLQAR